MKFKGLAPIKSGLSTDDWAVSFAYCVQESHRDTMWTYVRQESKRSQSMSMKEVSKLKIALLWSVCALLASLLVVPAALAQDADYVGNSKCKMCHNKKADGAIWTAWSTMAHAKALETLKGEEAKAIAEKAGLEKPAFESPECLRCHVTGYDAKKDPPVPAKVKAEQGVQCESCHGPASAHVKDGQAFKMKKDTTVVMSAHITRPTAKSCLTCHNEESPTWNAEKYTLKDGAKTGFDFEQAWKKIHHGIPKGEEAAK